MVELSKSIANKIKDKQGDITEDEVITGANQVGCLHIRHTHDNMLSISSFKTIRFKSYLLSMGIANPVTRETHGSGTHYHMQLAKQLGDMLQAPLEVSIGYHMGRNLQSLTQVYHTTLSSIGYVVRNAEA